VRGVDELVARQLVPAARVVLHLTADDAALGVEDRQPGADLLREGEQVQLGTQPAVVAALGLGQPLQVGVLGLLRLPRGAVDALELLVLLVAAPVGGRDAGQLERRDVLGGRHVRAAAQVAPHLLAGARVEVVVDGQLAAADLHHLVGVHIRLEVHQLQLERLGRQLLLRGLDRVEPAPGEPLGALDDLLHALLERGQVLRGERLVDREVVVEAVADRRADAELGLRELLLHGLGQHVRRRVPDDRTAVVGVRGDRLHLGVRLGGPGQVTQATVDVADHDHRVRALAGQAGLADRGARRRAGRHHHVLGGFGGWRARL
jgi:hypothetical protein